MSLEPESAFSCELMMMTWEMHDPGGVRGGGRGGEEANSCPKIASLPNANCCTYQCSGFTTLHNWLKDEEFVHSFIVFTTNGWLHQP
jgi:hypothetical protein